MEGIQYSGSLQKVPRVAEPWFLLQAFLNRLHASALAARQSPYSTAPLAQGPCSEPPSTHELNPNPSEPVEADSHTSLSHTLHPAALLHCQAAAETATHVVGTAAMHLSAEDPPAVDMAAAPLSPEATSPEATSPEATSRLDAAALLGSGPVVDTSQADSAAVAYACTPVAEGQDTVVSVTARAAAVAAATDANIDAADAVANADADADADADAEPASGVDGGTVQDAPLSLEWLRSAPPAVAAAFLMSVEGIAILSVFGPSMHAT